MALISVIGFLAPTRVFAHPMGNFSISHFAGLHITPGMLELRYILDLAEIPTFQEMQATGIVPAPGDPRVIAYMISKAESLRNGLVVALDGRPIQLEIQSRDVIFPPGAGNLPTMKIGVVYRASLAGAQCPCTIDYRDANYPERVGWKEVVATVARGLTLMGNTAPAVSRSQELANYPTDLIDSPPQDLSARLTFALPSSACGSGPCVPSEVATAPGCGAAPCGRPSTAKRAVPTDLRPREFAQGTRSAAPAVSGATRPSKLVLEANKQGTPRNRFTELISSNRWGFWFLVTAALIAAALGGLHALEPGHGKTLVAAYLVGEQGTAAHALILGLVVTVTHTAGVYALGLITLYASRYIVPDQLYPWLGIGSGASIALLGFYMLRRRYSGHGQGHAHHHHHHPWSHAHSHSHDHVHHTGPGHTHAHHQHEPGDGHTHGTESRFSYQQLVALGLTGGIIPCPAALVVLLSAVSLHRVAFGLYLIAAFSFGLAAVLIAFGLVAVYARRLLSRLPTEGPLVSRWLPVASAAAVTCLGFGIMIQALMTQGVIPAHLVISCL